MLLWLNEKPPNNPLSHTHAPPGQSAELLGTLIIRPLLQKLQDVHGSVEMAAGQADADRRLMFVTRQHPHFNSCQPHGLNGLLHLVLEPVGREGNKVCG